MRGFKLPSWVPDWHSYDRAILLAPSYDTNLYSREFEVSEDLTSLKLRGELDDQIISLSDIILPFRNTLDGRIVNDLIEKWPDYRVDLPWTEETVRVLDILSEWTEAGEFSVLNLPSSSLTKGWQKSEMNQVARMFYGKRVFRSALGHYGLVPAQADFEDWIVGFTGANVPYIIRPAGGTYSLIGECFHPYRSELLKGLKGPVPLINEFYTLE